MTHAVPAPKRHAARAALRSRRFTALMERSLYRAMIAHSTHSLLRELPDAWLRDIGLSRGDIPSVARAVARRLPRVVSRFGVAAVIALSTLAAAS